LWHWPFIAFASYVTLLPLTIWQRVAVLGAGFSAALLSWRFVETPFRKRRLGTNCASMFAFAGAGLFLVLILGTMIVVGHGLPSRLSPQARNIAAARPDMDKYPQTELRDPKHGKFIRLGAKIDGAFPSVFVWGDSHAHAALPALDALLEEKGIVGAAACRGAIAPVLNWFMQFEWDRGEDVLQYNEAIFSYLTSHHVQHVILVCHWEGYFDHANKTAGEFATLTDALPATVRRLAESGIRPWILLDVPTHPIDVPKALTSLLFPASHVESLCAKPNALNELEMYDPNICDRLRAAGAEILDPKPLFLDLSSGRYLIAKDGRALYYDKHHLSRDGALLLIPFLRRHLLLDGRGGQHQLESAP
jgi:hypothetical protein